MVESRATAKSVPNGVIVDLTEKKPIHVLHVDDDSVFLKVAKQGSVKSAFGLGFM